MKGVFIKATEEEINSLEKFNDSIKNSYFDANAIKKIEKDLTSIVDNWVMGIDDFLKNLPVRKFDSDDYYEKLEDEICNEDYIREMAPLKKELADELNVIKKNLFLEIIDKKRLEKRIESENKLDIIFNEKMREHEIIEKKNAEKYEEIKKQRLEQVNQRKKRFSENDESEINLILKDFVSDNPSTESKIKIKYNSVTKSCFVNLDFAEFDQIEKIKRYKYNKRENKFVEVYFSETERSALYQKMFFQQIVGIVFRIYNYLPEKIDCIFINGNVCTKNLATGLKNTITVASAIINKDVLATTQFSEVDSFHFLNEVNMRYKKPLSQMQKITPYFEFDQSKELTSLEYIDTAIDGFEFEKIGKEVLIANGFESIEVTKSSGDFGADIIAYKNDVKYAIQCKKFSSPVGIKAIQEVIGSKSMYQCHVAAVLTNNVFTPSAISLAHKNKVLLWDRRKLEEMLLKIKIGSDNK